MWSSERESMRVHRSCIMAGGLTFWWFQDSYPSACAWGALVPLGSLFVYYSGIKEPTVQLCCSPPQSCCCTSSPQHHADGHTAQWKTRRYMKKPTGRAERQTRHCSDVKRTKTKTTALMRTSAVSSRGTWTGSVILLLTPVYLQVWTRTVHTCTNIWRNMSRMLIIGS